jgi:hypothetical protein
MYGQNKLFLSFVVAILLLIILSGCGQESPATPEPEPAKAILSPVTIPYLVRNPIEAVYTEKTEDGLTERTFTISGLRDQELQNSINGHLSDLYQRLSQGELPPYRGIRQAVPETTPPSSASLDASLSFNYNNVISVMVYSNLTLEQMGKNPVYIGQMETLNIDLNTGKEIHLKDLFADDVDYLSLLSDIVNKRLMKSNPMEEEESFLDMMSGGFRLVAPFKGIGEDQKFALYQGGLVLIIDYENPEFDTGFYANTIYIPFEEMGPVIAVTERFTDPKRNLYQSENPLVYEFVQTGSLEREQKQELVETQGIQIYKTLNHPKELPEAAMKKIREFQEIDGQMILQFKETAPAQDEGVPGMEHNVWAVKAGRYTNVSRNLSFFSMNYVYGSREDYCYDEKGDLVVLEDLFVEGFQWENLVVSALEKAISQEPALRGENPDQWMQGLQFSLGLSEINFTTAPIQRADNNVYPLYFILSFEDIGCNNLRIFDSP